MRTKRSALLPASCCGRATPRGSMAPATRCSLQERRTVLATSTPIADSSISSCRCLSACGAAVLYRSKAFLLCGALDADFFAYLDDLDLALRIHLIGYRGVYVPDAVAYHLGSATLGQALHPRVVEYITRNQLFVLMKDYPKAVFRRLLPRIAVYQALWFLYAIRRGNLFAYLRGLRGAIGCWRRMRQKHRDLMAKRKIDDGELLALMQMSERQVYEWHRSQPRELRSRLLRVRSEER